MIATTKRIATNEIGGKSRSPTLIASQVELQTTQSVNQATGIRQLTLLVPGSTRDIRADKPVRKDDSADSMAQERTDKIAWSRPLHYDRQFELCRPFRRFGRPGSTSCHWTGRSDIEAGRFFRKRTES